MEAELSICLCVQSSLLKNLDHLGRTKHILTGDFHILERVPKSLALQFSLLQAFCGFLEFLALSRVGNSRLTSEVGRRWLLGQLLHESLVLALEHADIPLKFVN